MITLLATTTTRPLGPVALTADESARLASLTDETRRRQWLTSRRALRLLLGSVGLPTETTRYTFPHPRVSLAHTELMGAAAVAVTSSRSGITGVGVDIEPVRAADPRAGRFFLNEREQAWLAALPTAERGHHQVSLWTVKEALFKADMGNAHTTLRDYALVDPAAASGCAIKNPRRQAATTSRVAFGYLRTRLSGTPAHLSLAVAVRRPPGACASADVPTNPIPRRTMPTTEITFEEVAERISSTLSIPVAELTPDTTLADLAADSFMLVETVVDLQEEFDTMFSQTQLREVSNLGELVELLRRSRLTSGS